MKRRTSGENEDAPTGASGRKETFYRPLSHTQVLSKRFVFAPQDKRQALRIKVRREGAKRPTLDLVEKNSNGLDNASEACGFRNGKVSYADCVSGSPVVFRMACR